jgi:polyphosphate glucokinase
VSIGSPFLVVGEVPVVEPRHLGPGWVGFGYAAAFQRPIRIRNDAAMQALGGYHGGRMLFLGLGTGLGSALVVEGHLQPLELAHLPYRKKRTFEDYVGDASRERRGKRRWQHYVIDVATRLTAAMQADNLLIGGGNARHLRGELVRLPEHTRLGGNADAFRGGMRLWLSADERLAAARTSATTSSRRRSADRR